MPRASSRATCSSGPSGPATSMPGGSTSPRPTCSRPASTCGWGSGPCASAAASCPGTTRSSASSRTTSSTRSTCAASGAMLEARCPYLIELKERLDLPAGLRGKANPKSSTGRIDVFTRVITDHSDRFDEVAPGYQGPLYLEVVPLSFAVRVREDLTLNQLRLSIGRPWLSDDAGAGGPSRRSRSCSGTGSPSHRRASSSPTGSSWASTSTATRRAGWVTARGTAPPCWTSRPTTRWTRPRSGTRSTGRRATAWSSRPSASTC